MVIANVWHDHVSVDMAKIPPGARNIDEKKNLLVLASPIARFPHEEPFVNRALKRGAKISTASMPMES